MSTELSDALLSSPSLYIDTLKPVASQRATSIILAPCAVGWLFSVFLSGYVLAFSLPYLFPASSAAFSSHHRSGDHLTSEPTRVRWALGIVTALVVLTAGIHCVELGHYLVSQQRSFWGLQAFHWSDSIAPLPQGVSQGIVQFLLSTRALSLVRSSRWRIGLAIVLHAFTVAAVVFSIMTCVGSFMVQYGVGELLEPLSVSLAGALWYSISSLNDLIILGLLLVQFRRRLAACSPSPWLDNPRTRTDCVLRNLVGLSIGTWALTALLTVGTAVSAVVTRNMLYYDIPVAFGAPLGPLYALSLFVTLRAREGLRTMLLDDPPAPTVMADLQHHSNSSKRSGIGALSGGILGSRRPSHLSRHSASTIGTTILDASGFPLGSMAPEHHSPLHPHRRGSATRLDAQQLAGGVRVVQTVTVQPWRPRLAPDEQEIDGRRPSPIVEVDLAAHKDMQM